MLKAAVDHFGACVHTKDFVVFGKLPLPPSLDTAKMLNRTDRAYLTLVDTSMMQHSHYYQNIRHYLDLTHLPEQNIVSPIPPEERAEQEGGSSTPPTHAAGQLAPSSAQNINPKPAPPPDTALPDAATAAGIPVGRSGRTGAYMVDDLLKHTDPAPEPLAAETSTQDANKDTNKDTNNANTNKTTVEETSSQNAPLNMTSLPKERILWLQGGRVDELSSSVALRTVYLLYTNYVLYGDMQLAPQMRFSDHLTNTIKTHPFQVLRNVHLAETRDSSYFSDAPVLASFDFLTVNLHSIGGAFELGSSS
jgi:hypothetical protein